MNGGTVLVQTMWIQDSPLIYTHTELRGAAQVYVKAETGMFVFVLKAVKSWTMQPVLYCSDACFMSNQKLTSYLRLDYRICC